MGKHVSQRGNRRRKKLAVAAAVLLAAVNMAPSTVSAFTSKVSHAGTVQTASIVLTDNAPFAGAQLWTIDKMRADDTVDTCFTVTNASTRRAQVKMYATGTSALAAYLHITYQVGQDTGKAYGDCTGFSSSWQPFVNTLNNFPTTKATAADTIGAPWNTGASYTIRMSVKLLSTVPSSFQESTDTTTFNIYAEGVI